MDPFTDMLDAWVRNRLGLGDLVRWLEEWASEGAPASALCHVREYGTHACDLATDYAYYLAYALAILTN